MSRPAIRLALALFAAALVAVPAASAKTRDHRVQGVCSQQSTSKLKLSREDNGIEVEFQVDQNRNGVPWTVTLNRNDNAVSSFTATTRGPSGSFEIHRVIAGRLGTDRITAVATRASGETCTADSSAPKGKAPATNKADDNGAAGHDVGDDNGHHSGGHA
jgi:hypothetical protein